MKTIKQLFVGALWLTVCLLCSGQLLAQVVSQQPAFMERAQTQLENGVSVTVAVPSAAETKEYFGLSLYQKNVQPVWLDVTNEREIPVQFLPVGLDSWYYTPIESAMLGAGRKADASRVKRFEAEGMKIYIGPGERRSGFIFSRLDQGTKSFNVDFFARGNEHFGFTFFVPVPGLRMDHQDVDWDNLYSDEEIRDLDQAALIETLQQLPCCTTDKGAKGTGDPLNLVVIGTPDDVYYSFLRAGWDETEVISKGSLWRMGKAFVARSENRYSPVSGLYVFGRPQDVALQKARDNIDERNHLRLWMSPYRYQGKPVWIGQISRDIGVRLTRKTITTHKIDPDVDETREYLVENLAYSQSLWKLGYVSGVGAASRAEPRGNLTGDPYYTDGLRVVLWVTGEPVSFSDIQGLDWGAEPTR